MDEDGSLSTRAFVSDDVDELKGVADGAVGVRPAGHLVLPHLQHIVILSQTKTTFSLLLYSRNYYNYYSFPFTKRQYHKYYHLFIYLHFGNDNSL